MRRILWIYLIILGLPLSGLWGCSGHQADSQESDEEAQAPTEPEPSGQESVAGEVEDLENLRQELEQKLKAAHEANSRGAETIEIPKLVFKRPPELMQLSEVCTPNAKRPPTYEVTVDPRGESASVALRQSSGSAACDDLVQRIIEQYKWQGCEQGKTETACTFDFVVGFPSKRHRGLSPGS